MNIQDAIKAAAKGGNVDRTGERTKAADSKPVVTIPTVARDQATISAKGRTTAASIDGLATRARQDGDDRRVQIASALQKLSSGALDSQAAFEGAAKRLLDADFLSQ